MRKKKACYSIPTTLCITSSSCSGGDKNRRKTFRVSFDATKTLKITFQIAWQNLRKQSYMSPMLRSWNKQLKFNYSLLFPHFHVVCPFFPVSLILFLILTLSLPFSLIFFFSSPPLIVLPFNSSFLLIPEERKRERVDVSQSLLQSYCSNFHSSATLILFLYSLISGSYLFTTSSKYTSSSSAGVSTWRLLLFKGIIIIFCYDSIFFW